MIQKLFFLFLLIHTGLQAQYSITAEQLAKSIESATMKAHVYTLASPEFQGRETGEEGNVKAAAYIAQSFASSGIPPIPGEDNYYQQVAFSTIKWESITLTHSDLPAEHLKEFLSIPQYFPIDSTPMDITSMVFLGYGIDDDAYSDYQGVDVRGKHLLIYGGEPRDQDEKFWIAGNDSMSIWSYDPILKLHAAKKAGAASVWIIEERFREMSTYARRNLLTGATLMGSPEQVDDYLPHAFVTSTLGQEIAGKKVKKIIKLRNKITKTKKPSHSTIPVNLQLIAKHKIKATTSANVLGFVEGIDPEKNKEIVVVTAHFDHLGMRGNDIFFGADDNASGTSAVLEIAQALAIAKANGEGPARSVLCMLVTGEEKGLLGSQYYTEHPVFPIENTVANVNIDMIGRKDDKHLDSNYIYVIGADRLSTELHDINEMVNAKYTHLALDYTFNAEDDPNRFYSRSDHYNFAKNGIPAIFYFSGVHPDYHRATDTPDKIMYDKAATIAQLAFHTIWELANRDERIKVNVIQKNK